MKRDIKELEAVLRREIKELEIALRRDIKELDVALRSEMNTLRAEVKELEYRLTIKLGGMLVVGIGVVATLIKLL